MKSRAYINDITCNIPQELIDVALVYSEPPFRAFNLYKIMRTLNELGHLRLVQQKSSYFIVPEDLKDVFIDATWTEPIFLFMDNGQIDACLIEYGEVFKHVGNSLRLLNILKGRYSEVGDPCAGTGRSVEGFRTKVLFDNDPYKVVVLKSKVSEEVVLNKEKEEL